MVSTTIGKHFGRKASNNLTRTARYVGAGVLTWKLSRVEIRGRNKINISLSGADAGLLRGEGILCTMCMRK